MADQDLSLYLASRINAADFGDIRIFESDKTTVSLESECINVSKKHSQGFGIRIRKNGKWGFSSSSIVSKPEIDSAISSAYRGFGYLDAGNDKIAKIRATSRVFHEHQRAEDPEAINVEEKIGIVRDTMSLLEPSKNAHSIGVLYVDETKRWSIYNTAGASLSFTEIYPLLSVNANANCGTNSTCTVLKSISGNGAGSISRSKISALAENVNLTVSEIKGAKAVKEGVYDVVLDSEAAGVFAHETVGHMCETDPDAQKAVGRLGNKEGSSILNVIDDPTLPDMQGSYSYDQEGIAPGRKVLMKEGIFNECLYSLENAAISGMPPNGASRSIDYKHPPITRMSNTYIEAGTHGEDIFEGINKGILVFGGGGRSNAFTGQFFLKPLYGQMIRNGRLAEYVTVSMIGGDAFAMLKSVDAVGKEVSMFPSTCTKEGQPIWVETGGPNTRIRGVRIYG